MIRQYISWMSFTGETSTGTTAWPMAIKFSVLMASKTGPITTGRQKPRQFRDGGMG